MPGRALEYIENAIVPLDFGHFSHVRWVDIDGDGREELAGFGFGQDGGFQVARVLEASDTSMPLFSRPEYHRGPRGRFAFAEKEGEFPRELYALEGEAIYLYRNRSQPGTIRFSAATKLIDLSVAGLTGHPTGLDVWQEDPEGSLLLLVGTTDHSSYWPRASSEETRALNFERLIATRFDRKGRWKGGEIDSYLYLFAVTRHGEKVEVRGPEPLSDEEGRLLRVYGFGLCKAVEFDGDSNWDIICGDYLHGLTYFENLRTGSVPRFVKRGPVRAQGKQPFSSSQPFLQPSFVNWGKRGGILLGSNGGYVQYAPFQGFSRDHVPVLGKPVFLSQKGGPLNVGSFCTTAPVDWRERGLSDIAGGNEYGNITVLLNSGDRGRPQFEPPRIVRAAGKVIRHVPGPEGNIQGPCEATFGYAAPLVIDWDGDGLLDLIVADSLGLYTLYLNRGRRGKPQFIKGRRLRQGRKDFRAVWRVKPAAYDVKETGLPELITLDARGYLTRFPRHPKDPYKLKDGVRLLDKDGSTLKLDGCLNNLHVTAGRIQLHVADLDEDGLWDILYGTLEGLTGAKKWEELPVPRFPVVKWLKNVGSKEEPLFEDRGPVLCHGRKIVLGGHAPSPALADLSGKRKPDLIMGCDNGRIYWYPNRHLTLPRRNETDPAASPSAPRHPIIYE
jgi:hypothetical protein